MPFDVPRDPLPGCEECPKFEDCLGPHDCLLEPDPDAYKEVKEKLESFFAQDDPDEVSPENRRSAKSIRDITVELVFGENGKEARP